MKTVVNIPLGNYFSNTFLLNQLQANWKEFSTNFYSSDSQINLLQRNSFQWFHENELPMDVLTPVLPIRPQLMSDLRNCVNVMIQSHEELARSQTKFQV